MIQKRHRDGYVCIPKIIWVNSPEEAAELEILLIAEIGREDLGKGPLFNKTDGGDGTAGLSAEVQVKRGRAISAGHKRAYAIRGVTPGMQMVLDQNNVRRVSRAAAKHGYTVEAWKALTSSQKKSARHRTAKLTCKASPEFTFQESSP